VVPGVEKPEDWEEHRDGMLEDLAPSGPLELALAERVALLSWRLHRVTRYETETIAASQERMEEDLAQKRRFSASISEGIHPEDVRGLVKLTATSDATGALGGRVARSLANAAGVHARSIVLDADHDDADLPEMEVVEASYRDPASMRRALGGVHTLFMIPVHEAPDRVHQHVSAVDAALATGVERIVYWSFVGAAREATFTFARDHWHTEEHIRKSGVDFTFLRGNVYMDVLCLILGSDGVIRGPAGDGRVAAVAREDMADVAVSVLLGEGHSGVSYDVSGPESISMRQVAEAFSRAAGRSIAYHAETIDEAYEARAHYGAPGWEVEGWVSSLAGVAGGEMDVVSDAVVALTGHAPMTLSEFLRGHPESYQHLLPA
jgi:NAD(P)H dehydrogenase (quinone)